MAASESEQFNPGAITTPIPRAASTGPQEVRKDLTRPRSETLAVVGGDLVECICSPCPERVPAQVHTTCPGHDMRQMPRNQPGAAGR